MKKTKSAYEKYLNDLYRDTFRDYDEADENFNYLIKGKARNNLFGGIPNKLIRHYNAGTLGTLLRLNDPIAFSIGYKDWILADN